MSLFEANKNFNESFNELIELVVSKSISTDGFIENLSVEDLKALQLSIKVVKSYIEMISAQNETIRDLYHEVTQMRKEIRNFNPDKRI